MEQDKSLNNNSIKYFILKIDIDQYVAGIFSSLINVISHKFDRLEKEEVTKVSLSFSPRGEDKAIERMVNKTLIHEEKGLRLKFHEGEGIIILESLNYLNNGTYKGIVSDIVEALNDIAPAIKSKRIGMRYVNKFHASNHAGIGKIFDPKIASVIRGQLRNLDTLVRAMSVEEYMLADGRLKLQYGIPNDFYPGLIRGIDLVLDIDSYQVEATGLADWQEAIRTMNHNAYSCFNGSMNHNFIEKMK